MTEIDRSLIGQLSEPFTVEVEKGAIRKFADAIEDPDPLYRDEAYARRFGYEGIVAPPTFATTFRPPKEPPWFEPLDRRRVVAGQMGFEHHKPIVAGQRLTCVIRFVGVEDKQGSKGRMELLHQELQVRDEAGALVCTLARSTVYRSLEQLARKSLA